MAFASPVFSQLQPTNEDGVAMGHVHLNISEADYDQHRKLWIEGLGARAVMLGPKEILLLPDIAILIEKRDPAGGSEGTTINQLAFMAKDRDPLEQRWKELGGEIYPLPPEDTRLFLRFPGDVRVEVNEDPSLDVPLKHDHVHFFTESVDDIQAWYVKMLAAKPGIFKSFKVADVPGGNLRFSGQQTPPVGTKGRSLDHIGFEIDGLEAFCKQLEAKGVKFDRPYSYIERLDVSIAFFTDPWGTYIELTEGLDRLK